MSNTASAARRFLIGRDQGRDPGRDPGAERRERGPLPMWAAVPAFGAGMLASVAYAPDVLLGELSRRGAQGTGVLTAAAAAVVAILLLLTLAARQTVRVSEEGGGDYEIVRGTLGSRAERLTAAALLVDYALTVAVSVAVAVSYLRAAAPGLGERPVLLGAVLIALSAASALRGPRRSGRVRAVLVALFVAAVALLLLAGGARLVAGDLRPAPSAQLDLAPLDVVAGPIGALGLVLLALRTVAVGSVTVTGLEVVGHGVPAFPEPRGRRAAAALTMLGVTTATLLVGTLVLARGSDVRIAADPATQLLRDGAPIGPAAVQDPVLAQLAHSVLGPGAGVVAIAVITVVMMVLATGTGFRGFPALGSVLARDGYLPRQFLQRGDRLTRSRAAIALAVVAGFSLWAARGDAGVLIRIYVVTVFTVLMCGQIGMVRLWSHRLGLDTDRRDRLVLRARRALAVAGAVTAGAVLAAALVTTLLEGAWAALAGIGLLYLMMTGIRNHYRKVREELSLASDDDPKRLPSRSHAIVVVTEIDKPALRALTFAGASSPTTLEAVTVQVDEDETRELVDAWRALDMQVPLRILYSPHRDTQVPIVRYIRSVVGTSSRDVTVVYLPEFLVGHWWESLLHNHTAARLRGRLQHLPRVVVASVPWQLESFADAHAQPVSAPGAEPGADPDPDPDSGRSPR